MSVNILAIETSTDYGSIAISCNNEILFREITAPRKHSMWILSMIETLLAEAGLKKTQLDAIGFGRGPGSFTGIRLATSVAQVISFVRDIPIIPVSTLQALAQQAWRQHQCKRALSALDARLQQVYWGCYQHDMATDLMSLLGGEHVENPQQVQWPASLSGVWQGLGSGWDAYHNHLQGEWIAGCYPKAYDIATIARYEYEQGNAISAIEVKPLYLRDQVALRSPMCGGV